MLDPVNTDYRTWEVDFCGLEQRISSRLRATCKHEMQRMSLFSLCTDRLINQSLRVNPLEHPRPLAAAIRSSLP